MRPTSSGEHPVECRTRARRCWRPGRTSGRPSYDGRAPRRWRSAVVRERRGESVDVDWLLKPGLRLKHFGAVRTVVQRGHDDDRNVCPPRIRALEVPEYIAVNAREHHIEQDDAGANAVPQDPERLQTAGEVDARIPPLFLDEA
jgi:hypothetical protein